MKVMRSVRERCKLCGLITVLLAACFFLTGFSFMSALKVPKTDAEKKDFGESGFKSSVAQTNWASVVDQKYYSSPTNDVAAMKKVKKVAVVSFNLNLYAKKKTGKALSAVAGLISAGVEKGSINPEELKALTDEHYDDFIKALKNGGIEVIPTEQVLANETYKKFETGAKDGQVSGYWAFTAGWKAAASGRGLKALSAIDIIKPNFITSPDDMVKHAGTMQELAKSLGVDAVIICNNNVYMEASSWGGSYDLLYANNDKGPDGISLDVFSGAEPKLIWSASLAKALEVPTEAVQESKAAAIFGFTRYEFGKVMGDLAAAYRVMSEVMVNKLKMDM